MRQFTTHHAEPEVRHLGRFSQADPFKLDVGAARMLVQPNTITKQAGRNVHQDLVEDSCVEARPGGVGTKDDDVVVPSSRLGPGHGLLP